MARQRRTIIAKLFILKDVPSKYLFNRAKGQIAKQSRTIIAKSFVLTDVFVWQ